VSSFSARKLRNDPAPDATSGSDVSKNFERFSTVLSRIARRRAWESLKVDHVTFTSVRIIGQNARGYKKRRGFLHRTLNQFDCRLLSFRGFSRMPGHHDYVSAGDLNSCSYARSRYTIYGIKTSVHFKAISYHFRTFVFKGQCFYSDCFDDKFISPTQ